MSTPHLIKKVQLLHNPNAGDKNHTKETLVKQITDKGFKCRYKSIKEEGWEDVGEDIDMVAVASGDGAIRKVVRMLLNRSLKQKTFPIGIIPMGTANNIAKSLGAPIDNYEAIDVWSKGIVQKHDIGILYNVPGEEFFMEGIGYGIFPELMKQMKKRGKEKIEDPEKKLTTTLKLLHELILNYKATPCQIDVDGRQFSGKYLLVEVMNTKAIGPNLVLSEKAVPDDSVFEVVMVPESQRQLLADYVAGKLNGNENPPALQMVQGAHIEIDWLGKEMHVDDKFFTLKKSAVITIELREKLISFILPERPTPGLTE